MPRYHGSRKAIVQGAFHHHLVTDHARVGAYAEAVRRVVKPGDVVADLGAGSGLLSALAARAGAARVFAIEGDSNTFTLLERFVRANGLGDVVVPVQVDAEEWVPERAVDVVLCEMMETGLMNEDQVSVMNHVNTKWPHAPRARVPFAATLHVSLVHAVTDRHGFRMLMPHFTRDEEAEDEFERLTSPTTYYSADFAEQGALRVDATVSVDALKAGEANAVLLETTAHLAEGDPERGPVDAGGSPDHASPLVLPLDAPVPLESGDRLSVRLAYVFGSVTGRVEVDVVPGR